MYIRWLGAFGKSNSLIESLNFEFSRTSVVACEKIGRDGKSYICHASIGLLVSPKAVYANFCGDVYSIYDGDNLKYTRKGYEACSRHKESWAKPVYTGLVIKNGRFANLSKPVKKQIKAFLQTRPDMKIYCLADGKLKEDAVC